MERTGLLISVRDVQEAEAALAGGADLIDVKEPARGSLGKADDGVIRAIVDCVGGRVPVSAALGEWHEGHAIPDDTHLVLVKWGCAEATRRPKDWKLFMLSRGAQALPRMVFVAYADWQCAQAPAPAVIQDLACRQPGGVLLLDTHCKPAKGSCSTLLDWISVKEIHELTTCCRQAGCRVALAGSLTPLEVVALRECQPDWFAIRGAACEGGRDGRVSERKVLELARLLR